MSEPTLLKTRLERLWDDYREAAIKAQRSLSLEDGMAAGRAWHAFVNEFSPPDIREAAE